MPRVRMGSLRELVDHGGSESTSLLTASGYPLAEQGTPHGRPESKPQQEGPVRTGFSPEAFSWLDPVGQASSRHVSLLRVSRNAIRLTGAVARRFPEACSVEVGLAPRAVAFRVTERAGWSMARPRRRHEGGELCRVIHSTALVRLLEERGFGPGTKLLLEWDEEHRMAVAVKPRDSDAVTRPETRVTP